LPSLHEEPHRPDEDIKFLMCTALPTKYPRQPILICSEFERRSFVSSCLSRGAVCPALRKRSDRRRATEKPFSDLVDDIARLRKSLVSKSVSLNEAQRRQEMVASKVRETEFANDERALRATGPTIYEITLKNASSPGLPLPLASTNGAHAKDVKNLSSPPQDGLDRSGANGSAV
jgi:hypothetical protein